MAGLLTRRARQAGAPIPKQPRAADELDERPEVVYRVAIEHARGLVSLGRLDLDSALTQLTHAAAVADDGGHARGAASARRSLAAALTLAGRAEDALLQLDQARLVFRGGTEAAAVDAQRAWILERLGRVDEALLLMNRALAAFVRAGDAVAEANVRNNRGVLLGFRHEHQRASRTGDAAECTNRAGCRRPGRTSAGSPLGERGGGAALVPVGDRRPRPPRGAERRTLPDRAVLVGAPGSRGGRRG